MKKNLRRCIGIVLTIAMLISGLTISVSAAPAEAAPATGGATTMVFIIGQDVYTINGVMTAMDVSPVIIEDRTMLPIRFAAEPLGAAVRWEDATEKVTVQLMDTIIELWIGQSNALVNGVTTPIDPDNPNVKPLLLNDRTMLPLRFVTEKLGCDLLWEEAAQRVTVTKTANGAPGTGGAGDTDEPGDGISPSPSPGSTPAPTPDPASAATPTPSPGVRDRIAGLGEVAIFRPMPLVPESRFSNLEVLQQLRGVNLSPEGGDDLTNYFKMGSSENDKSYSTGTIQDLMPEDPVISCLQYFGNGYDAFGFYGDAASVKRQVLDREAMIKDKDIRRKELNRSDFFEVVESSASEVSKSMSSYAKISGSYAFFKGSVETNYSTSSTSKTDRYFSSIYYLIEKYELYSENKNYSKYILPDVKQKLNSINSYDAALSFFNDYGTHILVQLTSGGRLEYTTEAVSSLTTSKSDFGIKAKAKFNNFIASFNAEAGHNTSQENMDFYSKSDSNVKVRGGEGVDSISLAADPTTLREWKASVARNPGIAGFGYMNTSALVKIWENADLSATQKAKIDGYYSTYASGKNYSVDYQMAVGGIDLRVNTEGTGGYINAGRDIPGGGNINEKGNALYLFYKMVEVGPYAPITDLYAGFYPYDAAKNSIPVPEYVYQGQKFTASNNGNTATFRAINSGTNLNQNAKNVTTVTAGLLHQTYTRNAGHIYLFVSIDESNTLKPLTDVQVVKPKDQQELNGLIADKSWTFVSKINETTPFNFNTDVTGAPAIYIRYKRG